LIVDHTLQQINQDFSIKRSFFDEGNTRSYDFRRNALIRLRKTIKANETSILEALSSDLGKPSYEGYISEIGVTISEIDYTLSNLSRWMSPVSVPTPLSIQPATSKIYNDPKGVVVIFSPWNYPFNLTMIPLIGAIAAGNCIILKPAHETSHTSIVIEKIIEQSFDRNHVTVTQGEGKTIGPILLHNCLFNHLFFTGSPAVGKWMMMEAAKTLTPITLELGGKSPTIIDKNVDIKIAINRIVWAKYFNCGQTCTSPDYILVHKDVKDQFVSMAIAKIKDFYGDDAQKSEFYPRIINHHRFDKLISYFSHDKLIYGGKHDRLNLYIEPTIVELNDLNSPIMQEEIFGPIMPIITWEKRDELINIIRKNRYPLTCYVFSNDKSFHKYIINNIEFGSGCINDSMVQFANHHFPFGGIQTSGIGKYHGKYSFDTFSNQKPVLKTARWIDMPLRYLPHTSWKYKLAKWVLG
jgi:aldehyde dehydrogenase (NAD+)